MTLTDISRWAEGISLLRMSEALGLHPSTLSQRVKRGGPELTDAEQKRLREYLSDLGYLSTEREEAPKPEQT